jgi:homocitrate synthase NifV
LRVKAKLSDVTLRDGEQAPGLAFSLNSRVLLAKALDLAGVYQIEAGCPSMGEREIAAIKAIKAACQKAKVSAWCRIRTDDAKAAVESGADAIHLCLPIREEQLKRRLGKSWGAILDELLKCLALAKDAGAMVSVGLEDFSRANFPEIERAADFLAGNEIKRVRLSDTVGILTPSRVKRLVGYFFERGFSVEFHGHNDLGLAEANAYSAALAGAELLDVTLFGVGERAGNCSLTRLLALGGDRLDLGVDPKTAKELEDLAAPLIRRDDYIRELLNSPFSLELGRAACPISP